MKLKTYGDLNNWLRECQGEARHVHKSIICPSISKRDIWRVWLSLLSENDFDDELDYELILDVKREFPFSSFSDYVKPETPNTTYHNTEPSTILSSISKTIEFTTYINHIHEGGLLYTCTSSLTILGIGQCFTRGQIYRAKKEDGTTFFINDLGIKHWFGPDDGLEMIFEEVNQ